MEPLDAGVFVDLPCLGREPRGMRLDRSAQTSVAPVHCAKALALQRAPERLEQHRVRSVSMHQDDGFACHPHGRLTCHAFAALSCLSTVILPTFDHGNIVCTAFSPKTGKEQSSGGLKKAPNPSPHPAAQGGN